MIANQMSPETGSTTYESHGVLWAFSRTAATIRVIVQQNVAVIQSSKPCNRRAIFPLGTGNLLLVQTFSHALLGQVPPRMESARTTRNLDVARSWGAL